MFCFHLQVTNTIQCNSQYSKSTCARTWTCSSRWPQCQISTLNWLTSTRDFKTYKTTPFFPSSRTPQTANSIICVSVSNNENRSSSPLTSVVDSQWFHDGFGSGIIGLCKSGFRYLLIKNCKILQVEKIHVCDRKSLFCLLDPDPHS